MGQKRQSSFELPERNPEVEALQEALNYFRSTPPTLPEPEILAELKELTKQCSELKTERELFSFLGIPGSGKSKLLEKIAKELAAPIFHVRELVRVRPELKKTEEHYYRSGELIPGIEREFLDHVFKSRARQLLIDGFPRSLSQALELYRRAISAKRSVTVVETRLQPSREVFQSFYRQMNRASHRERKGLLFGSALEMEHSRILKKIQRSIELDLYVIEILRLAGADIIQLDATNGPPKMLKEFKSILGLE